MTTEFKLYEETINIYQMEHYILHMLTELNSKRNDGWVDEHYQKELSQCGKVIDEYIEKLNKQIEMFEATEFAKNYEKEKLLSLRKKINEIQRS